MVVGGNRRGTKTLLIVVTLSGVGVGAGCGSDSEIIAAKVAEARSATTTSTTIATTTPTTVVSEPGSADASIVHNGSEFDIPEDGAGGADHESSPNVERCLSEQATVIAAWDAARQEAAMSGTFDPIRYLDALDTDVVFFALPQDPEASDVEIPRAQLDVVFPSRCGPADVAPR